jgi:enediyne biosynthesis protein E4
MPFAIVASCTADSDRAEPEDTATTVVPTRRITVVDSGEIVCSDPSLRDVTKFQTVSLRAEKPKKQWFWGGGAIVADFDGDGPVDLMLPGFWETQWFQGLGGGVFFEIPGGPLWDPITLGSGGTAADYDGDGDLDVLITRYMGINRLLRNDGGVWTDVTQTAGLSDELRRSMVSSWGDYDRDGDLDLYIGCYGFIDESGEDPNHDDFEAGDPDFLYQNDGDGTFTDVSGLLPPEVHDGYAFAGGWFDVDRDGWLDLYVVNDFGRSFPNRLVWNRGGEFVLDLGAHGLDIAITGMGLGVGDINDDGIDDYVMSAWDGNSVMISGAGGNGWFESVDIVGMQNDLSRAQKIAWGVDLVDMDDDGDLDAPMAYGWLDANYPASVKQPDALYLQGDDGTFEDLAPSWGINHPSVARGFVATDLNDDGFLDLVKRDLAAETLVHLSTCDGKAWLRVRLREPGPNPFAIGARVVVKAGTRIWSQTVRAGGTNHASGGPPEVHFGLGDLDEVDAIEVYWADGETSVLEDAETRRILELTRE